MSAAPDFERPDSALLRDFSTCPVALVGDAMERRGIMASGLKPLWPGARVCGPAFTVLAAPGDNFAVHAALVAARPGDVLVVAARGYRDAGLFGELMGLDAVRARVAGLIVDGAVRDSAKLAELRFPVWARGVSPRGCLKSGDAAILTPIACGGEAVHPGDLILADEDGIVVVPLRAAGDVLERVRAQDAMEQRLRDGMAEGQRLFDALGLDARAGLRRGARS